MHAFSSVPLASLQSQYNYTAPSLARLTRVTKSNPIFTMSNSTIQQKENHPNDPNVNPSSSASSAASASASASASNAPSRPTTPGEISTDKLLASPTSKLDKQNHEPAAEAVLSYLRKRGLGSALLELQRHLDDDEKTGKRPKTNDSNDNVNTNANGSGNDSNANKESPVDGGDGGGGGDDDEGTQEKNDITELERLEEKYKDQESALTLMTGGGAGYDLDAAPAILSWTNGPATSTSTGNDNDDNGNGNGSKIRIRHSHGHVDAEGNQQELEDTPAESEMGRSQQDEARRCIQAFTALQTWVLSLPDEDQALGLNLQDLKNRVNRANGIDGTESVAASSKRDTTTSASASVAGTEAGNATNNIRTANFIPSSIKPELLSLTFPLLVHTYCDLLESNLEQSANTLLSTYRYIHEPRYPTEFRDLDKCNTSAGIAKLNEIVVLANEALSKAKTIRLSYDKRKNAVKGALPGTSPNPKVVEEIDFLQKEYEVVVKRHTTLFRQLWDYPF